MNKAYIIAMVMICFNFVLIWFNAMGFFLYQPQGIEGVAYNEGSYGFNNLVTDGFLIIGLTLLGGLISLFTRVNAFAMIMFINIFWFPYIKTIDVFLNILQGTPDAFSVGIFTIFTGMMLFVFAYALIEMSSTTVVSG